LHLFAFDRLDRYALRLFIGPLALVLLTLMMAQLLERLLRLLDLAASAGAPLSSVVIMVANLVPHYFGLALPMGITAAIFIAAARMSDDCELDVMLTTGRSIARIATPYFALAVLLIPLNAYLYGQVMPVTRYGYRLAVYEALQTGWNAKVEENKFIDAGRGATFSARSVDPDGKHLHGVFIERRGRSASGPSGSIEITTAAEGQFTPGPGGHGISLRLEDGMRLVEGADKSVNIERFDHSRIDRNLLPVRQPFRERGESARERTLPELWVDWKKGGDLKAAAEFHGRLARIFILPLLPLMALPLGMASKRGQRAPGVVFATLALILVNHALQFGESLAANGRAPAGLAVWTPFVLFGALGVWIFRGSLAWPGDNPVLRAVVAVEALFEGLRPRRRAAKAAAAS
jgi:lipopolysaccharide export system permease protein